MLLPALGGAHLPAASVRCVRYRREPRVRGGTGTTLAAKCPRDASAVMKSVGNWSVKKKKKHPEKQFQNKCWMKGFTSAGGSESFDIFGHLLTLLSGKVCDCFQRGWTSAVQQQREKKKGSENRDFLFYYEIATPETRTPSLLRYS